MTVLYSRTGLKDTPAVSTPAISCVIVHSCNFSPPTDRQELGLLNLCCCAVPQNFCNIYLYSQGLGWPVSLQLFLAYVSAVAHIDGKLLASAIYRCGLLRGRDLYFRNISRIKLVPCGTDVRLLLSGFQAVVTLTLTLDRVIRHTVVHQSWTSIYTPNVTEIGKTSSSTD